MAIAGPAVPVITRQPLAPPHSPLPRDITEREAERAPAPAAPAAMAQASHIRRCTFRRVMPQAVGRRQLQLYDVDCLHPSYESPVSLGALEAAKAACAGCTLPGVFRPDED